MTGEALIRYTCARCGAKKIIPANVGPNPDRPQGWGRWQFTAPGKTVPSVDLDVCVRCMEQVDAVMKRRIIFIGHARQSGSGKTWTELGLDRQDDPDRWFEVFAFSDGSGLVEGVDHEELRRENRELRRQLAEAKAANKSQENPHE